MTERARAMYEHFSSHIEKIIKGHRDQEFEDGIVAFITNLNLTNLTEAEKELVFSKTMTNTVEGRYIRDIIQETLNYKKRSKATFFNVRRASNAFSDTESYQPP